MRLADWRLVAVLAHFPVAAVAADASAEARLREALRTATAQVREQTDARSRLEASEARLKQQVLALQRQLAQAPRAAPAPRGASPELRRCLADQATASARLEASAAQAAGAARDAAEARARADQAEARATAVGGEQAALAASAKACEAKNVRMYEVARSLLEAVWKDRSGEPLLGLGRVELENFVQDAEDRLLETRVKP